jgi:hypothetical protein
MKKQKCYLLTIKGKILSSQRIGPLVINLALMMTIKSLHQHLYKKPITMDFFLTNNMYKMLQKVFQFDCDYLDGFDFQAQRDELKRIIKGSIIEEEQ